VTGRPEVAVRSARFDELDARTLYALLRLRVEVFVVEQECAYPELDGRDLEPGTRHLWVEGDLEGDLEGGGEGGVEGGVEGGGAPLAYLRVLDEGSALRIGRVCTAAAGRGRGLAAVLVQEVLDGAGGRAVVLDAQSYLEGWYARWGFERAGEEFVEDGIPHVPMRLPARGVAG
jgi:ElaA protein